MQSQIQKVVARLIAKSKPMHLLFGSLILVFVLLIWTLVTSNRTVLELVTLSCHSVQYHLMSSSNTNADGIGGTGGSGGSSSSSSDEILIVDGGPRVGLVDISPLQSSNSDGSAKPNSHYRPMSFDAACGGEEWEPWVLDALERYVHHQGAVMDVGTNVGMILLPLTKRAAPFPVFGFELSEVNRRRALRNLALNNICGIGGKHQYGTVVYDNNTVVGVGGIRTVTVVDGRQKNNNASTKTCGGGAAGAAPQQVTILGDRIDASWKLPPIVTAAFDRNTNKEEASGTGSSMMMRLAFVKMDCEGCELDFLRGASQLLLQHRPVIVFELWDEETFVSSKHPNGLAGRRILLDWFSKHGYSVSLLPGSHWDYLALP